jgi:hypothetical protein
MQLKLRLLFIVLTWLSGMEYVAAQGTAFTYQGQLEVNGQPANGSYNLTFALFSSSTGADPVGAVLTNSATVVSNGLFTVMLDYGNIFSGSALWLQIGVQTNTEPFTTLVPRQKITPAPYAIYTANAGAAVTAISAATANGATNFSGSLAGDVTGSQSATVVAMIGGQAAASVASATIAANAATNLDAAGAIVRRDASGNFSAGTISATFVGNGNALTNLNGGNLTNSSVTPDKLSPTYAYFYQLSPPDNAATVAAGSGVAFPRTGAIAGGILAINTTQFEVTTTGTYEITWQVPCTQSGQLVLTVNGVEQSQTVVGRASGTSQIVGDAILPLAAGSVISVQNPAEGLVALTITPNAGGNLPATASLVIKRLN